MRHVSSVQLKQNLNISDTDVTGPDGGADHFWLDKTFSLFKDLTPMKLVHFLQIKPQRDFKRFNLNKTINADMASLVQEQLLNISIVYQHLENTESEDRLILANISKNCNNKKATCPTPKHMVITPPPPHAPHPSGSLHVPGLISKPTRLVLVNVGIRPSI